LSANNRASRNPPAACSRVDPVNRATHTSVPVCAVCSATRRRSASADSLSRNATARDSTTASAPIASPNASSLQDDTGSSAARDKHPADSATKLHKPRSTVRNVAEAGVRSSIVMAIHV
jgi:hypothetical protein